MIELMQLVHDDLEQTGRTEIAERLDEIQKQAAAIRD
jgi:hypothetical protein